MRVGDVLNYLYNFNRIKANFCRALDDWFDPEKVRRLKCRFWWKMEDAYDIITCKKQNDWYPSCIYEDKPNEYNIILIPWFRSGPP